MRWVITGSGGQLGTCLDRLLSASPEDELLAAYRHRELSISEPGDVARLFADAEGGRPDVLINAAAFTAVDACEDHYEQALAGNASGPALLAERCADAGVGLVHVSTDYVLDGQASEPYPESADCAPQTAYGRSKAEGERRVLAALPSALVVRTAWVFGPGRNFVGAILNQARLRRSGEIEGPLRVVDDQRGCPTYAADLAEGLVALARLAFGPGSTDPERMGGVHHLCGGGEATWWDFAREILDRTGHADLEIDRIATGDLDLAAKRPAYSVLGCDRAAGFGVRLRPWREALAAYLDSPDGRSLLEGAP